MMTAEQKKELVRSYYQEIWTEGNLAFADRVFTDDYVNRDPASPGGCVQGREGFKQLVGAFRGAFQDMRMTIDHQHVDGDVVITEWTAHAVHRGSLFGIPPTGQPGHTTGVTISTFAGDKIREDRAIWDTFGLLARVGALPKPA
jgi:steroid delta-isomerase-like uncharacterized protein